MFRRARPSLFVFVLTSLIIVLLAGSTHAEPTTRPDDATARSPVPDIPVAACINLGGALEAPREGEWGYTIRRDDIRRIAQAGFDTIRLPVAWSNYSSPRAPHRIDPALFARVDEVIGYALDEGLNVILDVHHFYQLMHDPDRHAGWLDAIWEQLATHYEGWPDALIFEFLNEPFAKMDTERVDAMNHRLLELVRQRHPDRWVIMSGAGWGGLDGLYSANLPEDPKVIGTFHYYDPFNFTHQGATFGQHIPIGREWGTQADRDALANTMTRAAAWREETGLPVFLGEFGVYADIDIGDRAQWTRAVRRAAEREDIAWCYFDWATTFKVYDLSRERWLISMRHALHH